MLNHELHCHRHIHRAALALLAARGIDVHCVAPASLPHPLEVESVVLRLFEEAEVPAQEAGVVTDVAVREGQRVKQGELLAQIDDQVPRLAAEAAKAQYDIARAKATNDVRIRFAKKALEVSRGRAAAIDRIDRAVCQERVAIAARCGTAHRAEEPARSGAGRSRAAKSPCWK